MCPDLFFPGVVGEGDTDDEQDQSEGKKAQRSQRVVFPHGRLDGQVRMGTTLGSDRGRANLRVNQGKMPPS
jgi:hypothetical protein